MQSLWPRLRKTLHVGMNILSLLFEQKGIKIRLLNRIETRVAAAGARQLRAVRPKLAAPPSLAISLNGVCGLRVSSETRSIHSGTSGALMPLSSHALPRPALKEQPPFTSAPEEQQPRLLPPCALLSLRFRGPLCAPLPGAPGTPCELLSSFLQVTPLTAPRPTGGSAPAGIGGQDVCLTASM